MIVAELMYKLKSLDPTLEVHFQYNYGDHWRTQVAPEVNNVTEGYVKHSTYHNMDAVVDADGDDFDDEAPENNRVALIA